MSKSRWMGIVMVKKNISGTLELERPCRAIEALSIRHDASTTALVVDDFNSVRREIGVTFRPDERI